MDDQLLDVSGWELRKALQLFLDSNPALYEWLASPIVYRERGDLAGRLRQLVGDGYSKKKLAWHYLRMAEKNYAAYIEGRQQVRLKKYLYIVRPLLALQWMASRDSLPPICIHELLGGSELPGVVLKELEELIAAKRNALESAMCPILPGLDAWIGTSIGNGRAYCAAASPGRTSAPLLDQLFKATVGSDAPR